MIKKLQRFAVHLALGSRKFYYKQLSDVAKDCKNKIVLEIGSGVKPKGKEAFSAKHLFKDCKEFIQSDIDKSFGYKVVDITKMKYEKKFDVILCLSVLEHVFEFQKGIKNMHNALKSGGLLCISVPFVFPLHDEPGDYWRFTEYALKELLKDFSSVEIEHTRSRRFPAGYFIRAKK